MHQSLDPRINRLGLTLVEVLQPKAPLDQFGTYEVFLQLKDGKPFEHGGIVHAPNVEMAFLFGKEQFSRRYTCTGMGIALTQHVYTTPLTEGNVSVYDALQDEPVTAQGNSVKFEIFHLKKRGKQQVHMGQVAATSYQNALLQAKKEYGDQQAFQVWIIRTEDMLFNSEADKDIWHTLPEKKYRDAIAYKSADKINAFKERTGQKF
jgi:ring-1,2-phenylacetyl-CoA epoxidase subunit PaaB